MPVRGGGVRLKVEFESDLRTNAFVQMIGRPHDKQHPSHGSPHYCPFAIVVGVSALQLLMAWATYCYVNNNMILVMRNPILTSYEMFVGTNNTIPHGLVNQICGDWEDMEMNEDSKGTLAKITMPDGSTYGPNKDYSMFYNLKSPFRTFNYDYLGLEDRSVLDNTLYVIHEGLSVNPFDGGAGYSLLFVLMSAMWLFAILVEVRSLLHNSSLMLHFSDDPEVDADSQSFVPSEEDPEKYKMVKMPGRAQAVLFVNIVTRAIVTTCLAGVGCFFIMYTTEKINLILNSLAVLFVLELDNIIYAATVSGNNQQFIEDLEPVVVDIESGSFTEKLSVFSSYFMPALPFITNLTFAILLRLWQLRIFKTYFHMTVALCLFGGPTPGGETNLVNPVTGLCDSLLGATCAPSVLPNATLESHGRCVITDQKVSTVGTAFYYLDDPKLFEGRVDENGKPQSWTKWGEGLPELYEKGIWSHGPYQDIMRKNCLQMYQVSGYPENRLVDDDVIETMPGAPFYCQREDLWKAVFGAFTDGRESATDITMTNIDQVATLDSPDVIKAIDACKSTPPVQPHPGYPYSDPNALLHTKAHIHREGAGLHRRTEEKKQSKLDPAPSVQKVQDQKKKSSRSNQAPVSDKASGKRRKKLGPAGMLNIEQALLAASLAK